MLLSTRAVLPRPGHDAWARLLLLGGLLVQGCTSQPHQTQDVATAGPTQHPARTPTDPPPSAVALTSGLRSAESHPSESFPTETVGNVTTVGPLAVAVKPKLSAVTPVPIAVEPAPTASPTLPRTVTGPSQTGEGFRVYLQGTSPVRLGQSSTFAAVLEPQPPFKCNDKYPYRLSRLGGSAVSLTSSTVSQAQVSSSRTTLQLTATGTEVGVGTLHGTFGFSVCTAEKCLVERADLSLQFDVVAN